MEKSDLSHHILSRYNEELERVRTSVLQMGGFVEEQLKQAVLALVQGDSRLGEQIDNIRIRHRNLTEDVFTRLWSAFHVPYRLSAFYEDRAGHWMRARTSLSDLDLDGLQCFRNLGLGRPGQPHSLQPACDHGLDAHAIA